MTDEPTHALRELYLDNPTRYRILTAFLANPLDRFNLSELADAAGVSQSSIHRHKDDFIEGYLLDAGLITKVDSAGRDQVYTVNLDAEIAQAGTKWFTLNERAWRSDEGALASMTLDLYE